MSPSRPQPRYTQATPPQPSGTATAVAMSGMNPEIAAENW